MTLEAFIKYRDTKLAKLFNTRGYFVFSNEDAKRVFEVKPRTLDELGKVKGFPRNGTRVNKYGKEIISFFHGSHLFS